MLCCDVAFGKDKMSSLLIIAISVQSSMVIVHAGMSRKLNELCGGFLKDVK